jgi:hypothetical protein
MRNDWTLTPSEMALFIAAVTCLAGGFVMAAGVRLTPDSATPPSVETDR